MAPVTRAVVLARGLGSRMREGGGEGLRVDQAQAAGAGAKAMMPIGDGHAGEGGDRSGRPFLDFVLSGLADAGYRDACLVIGPEHQATRRYYTEIAPPARMRVHFAEQAQPRGTADAVASAAAFIGSDRVLVINGDNHYPTVTLEALRHVEGAATALFHADALVERGNIPRDRVRAFAIGTVDAAGFLDRLVEKPGDADLRQAGPNPLVSMNCWIVPPDILIACRAIAPSPRGELELTHAISWAIERLGTRFRVLVSDEGVLDLSKRDDVAGVTARLSATSPRP
jgi:dTDP-glucose pyrophosphorylase